MKRPRRTKAQMETLRTELYALVRDGQPCTVRHVYDLGPGRLWEKGTGKSRRNHWCRSASSATCANTACCHGQWITDGTRLARQDMQYDSVLQALERTAKTCRRNIWASRPRRVEVWCESYVLYPVVVVA
ncbi:hypothetical protein [Kitasatospora purpeofusca]|uniref:hypothetical protein n=1 Tax=Kitasatospora purpeofusca TaxID=67352 RepID=UPI003656A621